MPRVEIREVAQGLRDKPSVIEVLVDGKPVLRVTALCDADGWAVCGTWIEVDRL